MKKALPYILGLLVLVLLILLLTQNPSSQDSATDRGLFSGRNNDAAEDMMDDEAVQSFDGFLTSLDWDRTDSFKESVNSVLDIDIIVENVFPSPTDENTYYISASTLGMQDDRSEVHLFTYSYDTYEWERIYRGEFEAGEAPFAEDVRYPEFMIVGVDGDNLILLATDSDYSPHPCSRPLLLEDSNVNRMLSMSLSEPYSGFTSYEIPEDVLEAQQEISEACFEELS
jgi:hypothetical protein